MPVVFDIDHALWKWQVKHGRRMTYADLAKRAGISLPTLYRLKSGEVLQPDLRKVNKLCKVLECEPGDLLLRVDTSEMPGDIELARLDHERREQLLSEIRRLNADQD